MGRWLEVVAVAATGASVATIAGAAMSPSALLAAARALPSPAREHFPSLLRIADPTKYQDESIWLAPGEVGTLRSEFERMRRITARREFLSGVDGGTVLKYWRGHDDPAEFERYLDQLSALLEAAEHAGAGLHFTW